MCRLVGDLLGAEYKRSTTMLHMNSIRKADAVDGEKQLGHGMMFNTASSNSPEKPEPARHNLRSCIKCKASAAPLLNGFVNGRTDACLIMLSATAP